MYDRCMYCDKRIVFKYNGEFCTKLKKHLKKNEKGVFYKLDCGVEESYAKRSIIQR